MEKTTATKKMATMNLIMSIARISLREDDFDEHKHTLLIDNI